MEIEFVLRNIETNDWATVFFIVALVIIAYNKWVYTAQFSDFSKMIYSNKYIKLYREESNLKSWFTLSMTFVQFLSLSFLIHIFISEFSEHQLYSFRHYVQILNVLTFLVLSKYIVEKIIAICFNMEEFMDQFSLVKVSYRSYIGLLLLPIVMILFYNQTIDPIVLYILGFVIILTNLFIYSLIIKNYQKYIGTYFYYFILYLCTFEIAPYYILYKWYINSGI